MAGSLLCARKLRHTDLQINDLSRFARCFAATAAGAGITAGPPRQRYTGTGLYGFVELRGRFVMSLPDSEILPSLPQQQCRAGGQDRAKDHKGLRSGSAGGGKLVASGICHH